jgi:exoribonuclease II
MALDVSAHLVSVLHAAQTSADDEATEDDDDTPAGPLAIAVDMNEAPSEETTGT